MRVCLSSSADFFFFFLKNHFLKKNLSGIPLQYQSVLDLDQARRIVGPDLGPNCLHMLSADDTR